MNVEHENFVDTKSNERFCKREKRIAIDNGAQKIIKTKTIKHLLYSIEQKQCEAFLYEE
jgi:hypothetical protein